MFCLAFAAGTIVTAALAVRRRRFRTFFLFHRTRVAASAARMPFCFRMITTLCVVITVLPAARHLAVSALLVVSLALHRAGIAIFLAARRRVCHDARILCICVRSDGESKDSDYRQRCNDSFFHCSFSKLDDCVSVVDRPPAWWSELSIDKTMSSKPGGCSTGHEIRAGPGVVGRDSSSSPPVAGPH